jgi:hypothetical protein
MLNILNSGGMLMKKNKKFKVKDLHFDDDINLVFNNSIATEYINKLKVGNIIDFSFKDDGRKRKPLITYGIVKAVYANKFCLNVDLKNRREVMLITANDICENRYQEIKDERIIN